MKHSTIFALLLGAALLGTAASAQCAVSVGPDNVNITIQGECPGQLVVRWEGATPDRPAAIAFSRREGHFTLPAGPCHGTVLGLSSGHGFRDVRDFRTGSKGRGRLTGQAHLAACGGYLQMIVADGLPCTTSNVVQIPQ